jgi:hypothetical protein
MPRDGAKRDFTTRIFIDQALNLKRDDVKVIHAADVVFDEA